MLIIYQSNQRENPMENPPTDLKQLREEIENDKKYIKRYIQKKDYWTVWQYIFTGKLSTEWIKDTQ